MVHNLDMKRLLDILHFALFFDLGMILQLKLIFVYLFFTFFLLEVGC